MLVLDTASHERKDLDFLERMIPTAFTYSESRDDRLEAQIVHAFLACEEWERGLKAVEILSRGQELPSFSKLLFQKTFIQFKSDRLEEAKQCCQRGTAQLRLRFDLWPLYLDYIALLELICRHENEVNIADEYAKMLL